MRTIMLFVFSFLCTTVGMLLAEEPTIRGPQAKTKEIWQGTVVHSWNASPNPWSLAVSPDNTQLVVAGSRPRLLRFDIVSGKELPSIAAGTGNVYGVCYSHDGKRIACATSGNEVPLHETKEEAEQWETTHAGNIGNLDITARIYNTADGTEEIVLSGHKNRLLTVAFTPDDKFLLTAGMDRTIRLWDTITGTEKHVFYADSGIASLEILANGRQFATGHANGSVRLWDIESKKIMQTMKGENGIIWQVSVSPDNCLLFSTGFNNPTRLWNLETGEMIRKTGEMIRLFGEYSGAESVRFSPDGKYYLVLNPSGKASLRRLSNDMQIAEFGLGDGNFVRAMAFTPDGQNIITSFLNGEVVLWE